MIVQDKQSDEETDEVMYIKYLPLIPLMKTDVDPDDTADNDPKTWYNKKDQLVFTKVQWPVMMNFFLIFLQSAANQQNKKFKWPVEGMGKSKKLNTGPKPNHSKSQMVFYTTSTLQNIQLLKPLQLSS